MFAMDDVGVPPRRGRGGTLSALALALGVATLLHVPRPSRAGFRHDELECEEAVAHLERCCGALPAGRVSCEYDEWECGSRYDDYTGEEECGCSGIEYDFPDLHGQTSDCIRERTCDELRATGICADALDPEGGALTCG